MFEDNSRKGYENKHNSLNENNIVLITERDEGLIEDGMESNIEEVNSEQNSSKYEKSKKGSKWSTGILGVLALLLVK